MRSRRDSSPPICPKTVGAAGHGEWAKQVTPLERLGDMKELVGAAVFLASHAAGFITGQILRVDGGISAGMNWPIEL
ncbi:SDR family oxidoreductase [Ottowia sp.]|uniref:SDR family oxidoreductase n=1 Tax=Ottowia sp. TaxID=1898956 RepID=UPI0034514982